jgi:hypothetical protein
MEQHDCSYDIKGLHRTKLKVSAPECSLSRSRSTYTVLTCYLSLFLHLVQKENELIMFAKLKDKL